MLLAHLDEGFVRALHDPLAADIDPAARRHLAVHHEAFAVERVEMLPRRPVRHEIGIGEQHARRVFMRLEHADGFARLYEQRLIAFEALQGGYDAVEAFPIARGTADAAIDDEFFRAFGHFRVEIVHEHAQRRFGQPAFGVERGPAGRTDAACVVQPGHDGSFEAKSMAACRSFDSNARNGAARSR